MAKFEFRLPTRDNIRDSANGGIMLSIIDNDYDEKFTLVTGCPGSGKTTVSIFRLIRLANNGKSTVLLTYQRMLKVAIENLLTKQGLSRQKVNTVHSWFYGQTKKFLGFSNHDNKLSATEIADALRWRVGKMELILDEAQDLEERIFQAFPRVFGKITIGADNDQQVHAGSGSSERTITRQISHSYNEFTLQFNYRNTYQIYNFARYFVPNSLKANDMQTLLALIRYKNNGDLPEVLKFDDQKDMQTKLKTIIEDNIRGFNIGVLFPYKNQVDAYHSHISGFGFECSKYYSQMPNSEKNETESDLKSILVTTFISAKGMEFDIVIMPEFESIKNTEDAKRQAYVGCTRAKNRLVIMHTGSKPFILNNFPSDTYNTGDLF